MERGRLLVGFVVTILMLPLLLIDNIARATGDDGGQAVASNAPVFDLAQVIEPTTVVLASLATQAPTTLPAPPVTEPAPPVTDAPTTTQPPRRESPTTTEPPPEHSGPPATTTPPESEPDTTAGNAEEGGASWYDYRPGECAHRTLPMGTVITVTSLATGASTSCTVTDRGPFGAGRIVDLDRATFAQLADPSVGVIDVRITW